MWTARQVTDRQPEYVDAVVAVQRRRAVRCDGPGSGQIALEEVGRGTRPAERAQLAAQARSFRPVSRLAAHLAVGMCDGLWARGPRPEVDAGTVPPDAGGDLRFVEVSAGDDQGDVVAQRLQHAAVAAVRDDHRGARQQERV